VPTAVETSNFDGDLASMSMMEQLWQIPRATSTPTDDSVNNTPD
jgi:hypothetical protein